MLELLFIALFIFGFMFTLAVIFDNDSLASFSASALMGICAGAILVIGVLGIMTLIGGMF